MKLLKSNLLKFLLFSLFGVMVISSCEKEYGKQPEEIKEIMATVSKDIAVAGGDTLTFTDLSLGVVRRTWTFPGGDPETSDKAAPNVVFLEEGNTSPKLIVEYFDGTKDSLTLPVTVYPVLIADFTPSTTKIKVGETVTFTDASIGGATSWAWEFEGGTPATSTEQNPSVTFSDNQPVSITLTITRADDGSVATIVKDDLVQVGPYELCYNGSFEDQQILDFQTWNGAGFPLVIGEPGANGTNYCAYFDYEDWGGAELMSRDKPAERMIAVENGQSYTVSLYIKADDAGVLTMGWFQLGNNPLDPWSYSSVWGTNGQVLTTEWQKIEFIAAIPDDGIERINNYHSYWITKVDGGATVNTRVYIDELSLKIVE